ncbi:MFS transporter-16 [Coleophoma crateriformis]|uniref:MFS transporter-16 n=1 Tax=Coleophoma crateriformis TaxID=565419 RepID=A0A3D8Q2G6_9HELO|nr:MFS transporter-16 [Coleophoma crateriformis]
MAEVEERLAPGTVHLIDANGELHVKHSESAKDIVLLPLPSDDPEDPLNWTKSRKLLHTSCVVMFTVMMVFPSAAVYSVTTPISLVTKLSIGDQVSATGAMFLFYGWGCILWQPLALQYGKRPVYLISMAASVIILGLAPLCTTNGPYLANKILQGFFGAPVETLCEISMTDIWFAHERPLYLAIYGLSLAFSASLAPAFAAFINAGQNWKWTLWWCAIGIGVALVYCFFLMEETNYDRKPPQPAASADSIDAAVAEKGIDNSENLASESKPSPSGGTNSVDSADVESGNNIVYGRKSYWQKLSVIDKPRPNRLLEMMWSPFKFSASLLLSGLISLYTVEYNFTGSDVGYAYFAQVVGMCIEAVWVAFIGPKLVMKLARRNGGVAEPEHILWLYSASLFAVPFGLLLWGLGAEYKIHWFGLVFAQCMMSFSSTQCLSTSMQYATSSYRDLSGEFLPTLILIRNTLSFAINYGITPWINAEGQRNTFITVAVLALVCNSSMLVMIKYGKRIRQSSASVYWDYVKTARENGLSH